MTAHALAEEPAAPATAPATQDTAAPPAGLPAEPPPPPPPPTPASPFQGATLTSVTYERADMAALTAGKAALGMLGGMMMVGDGDTIVKEFGIADPAVAISARLTPMVAARYQTSSTVNLADRDSSDDSVSDLTHAAGGKGLVVDVETRSWLLGYFPFDWSHYRVMYSARARLIDATTGKQIARETCDYSSGDDVPSPTYDEVLANSAALLKAKLDAATASCVDTLAKKLLGP